LPRAVGVRGGERANTGGILTEAVSTSQTIFAWWNLLICIGLFVFLPIVNVAMHPKDDDIKLINPALLQDEVETVAAPVTPAEKIENSRILQWIAIIIAVVYLRRVCYCG
jgi:short-chain fatty acids transporter